jgi:hypothetical protein
MAHGDRESKRLRILAARSARGLLKKFRALKSEGAGNAGCALHPRSRVQKAEGERTRADRFSGGTPTFPAQWLYGLLRALPGESGFVASIAFGYGLFRARSGRKASEDLTPTTEASGPHDFTVRGQHRSSARRLIAHGPLDEPALPSFFTPDAAASTASRPASLTIRIRPGTGRGGFLD